MNRRHFNLKLKPRLGIIQPTGPGMDVLMLHIVIANIRFVW
jgi:hypothetical protein